MIAAYNDSRGPSKGREAEHKWANHPPTVHYTWFLTYVPFPIALFSTLV
jgi:hypothetical protein